MYKAIAANKRNTVMIMTVFVGFVGAIGWLVGAINGQSSIGIGVLVVAGVYALIQYVIADKLALVTTGAREITKADSPRLWRTVENLSITTGMPRPKVCLIDDPSPNAFATGRDPEHAVVAATTGLLEIMDNRELTAVIAHEMGHVRNYDIRVSMIAFGLVSAIGLLSDMAFRLMWFGGDDREDNANSPLFYVIGFVLILISPLIAAMIQMAISRQREYLADATGVFSTRDPEGLASALEKLMEYGQPMRRQSTSTAHLFFSNPLKPGLIAQLFSTHPPLEARIARLKKDMHKW